MCTNAHISLGIDVFDVCIDRSKSIQGKQISMLVCAYLRASDEMYVKNTVFLCYLILVVCCCCVAMPSERERDSVREKKKNYCL